MTVDIATITEQVQKESAFVRQILAALETVIVGQRFLMERILVALLTNGHVLIEGVPGLAKTKVVKSLANLVDARFQRIQFTPDLLPADLIGTLIYNPREGDFTTRKGPIFSNVVLADEINRAPAKVHSALLEAMEERQVTIGETSYPLEELFLVLATQNPIEQEGTYPLPEAQLDRFMFSIWLDYPRFNDELTIVKNTTSVYQYDLQPVITGSEILFFQELIRKVPINDQVIRYAVKLAARTRPNTEHAAEVASQYLKWGAGPRASQYLVLGAKTHAVLNGKYAPDIEDVQTVAPAILRHRIIKNNKAEAENISMEAIISKLL